MENKELYIKYLDSHPVPVDTSYGRGPQGTHSLNTVAHLIAAYQARPGSLLANTDSGLITLHSFNDKVETSYNSWDPLTVLGDNGKLGTNPLIIRSRQLRVDTFQNSSNMISHQTGTLGESRNSALKNYQEIAQILKDDESVIEIYKVLIEITSEPPPADSSKTGFTHPPFVFLEGSSGSGKSQMAFSIQAKVNTERKCFYLLFHQITLSSQKIYLNYTNITKLFIQCYECDFSLQNMESPSCTKVFGRSLFLFGFIYDLISNGIRDASVEITQKKGVDVLELMRTMKIINNRPIFILDECIPIDENSHLKVRFVKNCFRSLGLGFIMLGTDSRAAKLTIHLRATSRDCETILPWCYIFSKFPSFSLSAISLPDDTEDWFKSILKNSRPLFSQFAASCFTNNSVDFDSLLKNVFEKIINRKNIFQTYYGQLGQIQT